MLETDRIILRRWRTTDDEPFARMNACPRVMTHLPHVLDAQASRRLRGLLDDHIREHGFGLWALENKASGALMGFTGLCHVHFTAHFTPAIEVGWRLDTQYWGQGFATEAARRALVFAFEELELPRVVSFTVPANGPSVAVMERLGMTRVEGGDFEHPRLEPGHHLRPHVLYVIQNGLRAGSSNP